MNIQDLTSVESCFIKKGIDDLICLVKCYLYDV